MNSASDDQPDTIRFGRFELRRAARRLVCEGSDVALGARAFDLLQALIERRDRIVDKDELLDIAWPGLVVEESNLTVQISVLRKALGPHAITTAIMGVGCARRFKALNWELVERILWGWVMTVPATALLAYGLIFLAQTLGWVR